MKKYFISATGTNIGKTFFLANLCSALLKKRKSVTAIKPVITGFLENDSDSKIILESLGISPTIENIEKISPWRFTAPLSPDMAARFENREIIFSEVVKFCKNAFSLRTDFLFIEGVGGVMTPLNEEKTIADITQELHMPVLLVGGGYLGSLSHMLTAVEFMKYKKIPIHAVIINEALGIVPNRDEILKTLGNFIDEPVFFLPDGKDSRNLQESIDKILDFL